MARIMIVIAGDTEERDLNVFGWGSFVEAKDVVGEAGIKTAVANFKDKPLTFFKNYRVSFRDQEELILLREEPTFGDAPIAFQIGVANSEVDELLVQLEKTIIKRVNLYNELDRQSGNVTGTMINFLNSQYSAEEAKARANLMFIQSIKPQGETDSWMVRFLISRYESTVAAFAAEKSKLETKGIYTT